MNRTTTILGLAFAASTALLATAGCGGGAEANLAPDSGPAEGLRPQRVEAALVATGDLRPSLRSTGTLVPKRKATIHALVEGRLDEVPVDIGTRVARGARMFVVRTDDYEIALRQAEAALARAKVALADAEREDARAEGLFREGSATEQMRDQAKTAKDEAHAAEREADARAALARRMLADATAEAPYAGAITARFRQRGEFVSKGDPVVEIMDLATLEAEMEIPEPFAGTVAPGLEVSLAVRGGEGTVAGRVVAVNPKIDLATRTFTVKVEVDNRPLGLPAGLFCTGSFALPERIGLPSVPASAVQRDEGRSFVWVVGEGKVSRRVVREAGAADGTVFVESGLEPGERVVTAGAGGLFEGAEVEIGERAGV